MSAPTPSPLKAQALRGARWTSYGTVVSLLLQTAQLLILARWLSPTELGLAAIALAVGQLALAFVDLGVSNALISAPRVSPSAISLLWLLSLASATLLAGVLTLGGGAIAAFYSRADLEPLLGLVGLSLVVAAPGVTYRALLQRELRFKTLAAVETLAAIAAAAVNLTLVLLGFGVISLAWGAVARALISALGHILPGRALHPWAPPRWAEAVGYLRFGAYQLATVVLSFLGLQADTLLTGRLIGLPALGLLDTAKSLVMRPMLITAPVLQRVMTPVLARVAVDRPRLRQAFIRSQTLLYAANLPLFVGMALAADPLVRVVLGEQWLSAIPLLPVLALMGIARVLAMTVGPLVMALGLAARAFWWNLGFAASGLAAVLIGAHGGVTGVAWAVTLQIALLALAQYFGHIRPYTGASLGQWLSPLAPYTLAAAVAAAPTGLVLLFVTNPYVALALAAVVYASTYAAWLWRTHPEARELVALVRSQGLLS